MKVLVADDDRDITAAIALLVEKTGNEPLLAYDGEEALDLFDREAPDVVVLDVMMPKMNGYDVCQAVRERSASVPVMLLTARGDIVDKSIGFKAGADDYVVKPFDAEELVLRICAHLRRSAAVSAFQPPLKQVEYRDLFIDFARRLVTVRGEQVELTPKEFHLLKLLALNAGEVLTKDRLVEEIWGPDYVGEINGITVLVHRLREKVERDPTDPEYVKTVWHVGYRFGE